ncbi:MAG: NAD(P)H-dependent oxidoreductase [Nitrosomonas sp.]|nr:NAD(P)H-dependent oxidoreductase [Nitrosomonas sp.]
MLTQKYQRQGEFMARRIAIIQGHPDTTARHFCHALAEAYLKGAQSSGFEARLIDVAVMDFTLLRSKADFESGTPAPSIIQAQNAIRCADHLAVFFPLWLGGMPALLKAFFEQTLRPGFAFEYGEAGQVIRKHLTEKSARVIVTMGMPAWVYRWFYCAHGVKALERNILAFCGINPVRTSLIGSIENLTEAQRLKWLSVAQQYGAKGR